MITSFPPSVGRSVRDKAVGNHERFAIYGVNRDVDTLASEDVWNGGGTYPWLASETALEILSDSASDDDGAVGARTVVVNGLDANFNRVAQIVTLNGITPVSIPQSLYRINSVIVNSAGDTATNVGSIVVRDTATSTTRALIEPGHGITMQCIYTVPADYELILTSVLVAINRTDTSDRWASFTSWLRTPSGIILKPAEIGISSDAPYRDKYDVPAVFATGTDLAMNCEQVSSNNTNVTASLMGYLSRITQ